MTKQEELLVSFIEKLLVVIPETVAVYEFTKELALFDKFLKKKKGLVIIINENDYSIENLLLIDLIYDKLQDEYGREEGVRFANSFSRSYIRTVNNFWHINIMNNHCLLPEDQLNLKKTRKLLYGTDVIPTIPFFHKEEDMIKINVGFLRSEADVIAGKYPYYHPLAHPDCCWMRHDFTIDHSLIHILKSQLLEIKNNVEPEKNTLLYGRYGGSGKTQIIYSTMKICRELSLPFVYRTEFWKDEKGKYLEIGYNPVNSIENVNEWIIKNAPGPKFILFLDEIDADLQSLREQLSNRFPNNDILLHVISGAKEISYFVDDSFDIYDISKEYTFSETQLKDLIQKLIQVSNIDKDIFSEYIVDLVVKKTRLWNHSSIRKTPTAVILTATLALLETLKHLENTDNKLEIKPETVEKWAILGTSPWYQRYGDLHDVHAEYLIFDGEDYIGIDKHYKHPLP